MFWPNNGTQQSHKLGPREEIGSPSQEHSSYYFRPNFKFLTNRITRFCFQIGPGGCCFQLASQKEPEKFSCVKLSTTIWVPSSGPKILKCYIDGKSFPLKQNPWNKNSLWHNFLKECTNQNDGNKQQKNHIWALLYGCQHTLQNSHKRIIKTAPTKFYKIVTGA
jgi:hypothetical protein